MSLDELFAALGEAQALISTKDGQQTTLKEEEKKGEEEELYRSP